MLRGIKSEGRFRLSICPSMLSPFLASNRSQLSLNPIVRVAEIERLVRALIARL